MFSMTNHEILCLSDPDYDEPSAAFRVIASTSEMWSLHSNLKVVNFSFEDDGVYRRAGRRFAEATRALVDTLKSAKRHGR
jgi:hypothetical protein